MKEVSFGPLLQRFVGQEVTVTLKPKATPVSSNPEAMASILKGVLHSDEIEGVWALRQAMPAIPDSPQGAAADIFLRETDIAQVVHSVSSLTLV
jgi:hypothetical protein